MASMTPRTEKPEQRKLGPDSLPRTRLNRVHILYDREKVSPFHLASDKQAIQSQRQYSDAPAPDVFTPDAFPSDYCLLPSDYSFT